MLRWVIVVGIVGSLFPPAAVAEEFTATLRKVQGEKILVHTPKNKSTKEKARAIELTVSGICKVYFARFNKATKELEAGEEVEGGLKNAFFRNLPEEGVAARVYTDEQKKVTELRLFLIKSGKK